MKSLFEIHRPKVLSDILGQDKAVKVVKKVLERGIGSRSIWISGASGIGKTTLARIIASSIADSLYIQEYDSADQLSIAELDKIESNMQLYAFGKGGKCWIINESHALRATTIRRLLGLLERIPSHCCFIFTTTKVGQEKLFEDQDDSGPLLSRCIKIELSNQGLCKVFALHCRTIAQSENLDGKSLQSYEKLLARCKNNMRMALNEIESGCML